MSKVDLRKEQLLRELSKQTRLSMSDIQTLFQISESTARRLCVDLEKEKKAVRIFGGLQISPTQMSENAAEYSYERRATENVEEKMKIGAYAATLVENRDIIYISGGTTAYELVKVLCERIRSNELANVLIVTNSLVNAEALSTTTRVILTGGEFRPKRRDLAGYVGEQTLMSTHFNKCFMGVDGIDLNGGIMTLDMDTATMDKIASEKSEHTFILADHHKFHKQSFVVFERFGKNHTLITDSGVEPELPRRAKESGIKMSIVGD
jgi:DeoR/GlpR family transcriptional regulator of sugar metabolism